MQQTIAKIDIINVANSINKKVSDTEINWILENYNDYENEDPESNWSLIVENMLYNLPKYKVFNIQYNVGKAKYVVNYHNGFTKHEDGSPFFDIATFANKEKFEVFKQSLLTKGYKQTN